MPTIDPRLTEVTLEALRCRTKNHRWDETREDGAMIATAYQGKKIVQVMEQLVCAHCGTKREDLYSYPDYESVIHRYRHPDGYLIKQVEGAPRMVRSDFRLALFTRRKPAIVHAA